MIRVGPCERAYACLLAHDLALRSTAADVSVLEDAALAELAEAARKYRGNGVVFCVWARRRIEAACRKALPLAKEAGMKALSQGEWLDAAFPREDEYAEEAVAA